MYGPNDFVIGKSFQPIVMQQSSLFGPFISYEENEVLWIWAQLFIDFRLWNQRGSRKNITINLKV